MKFEILHHLMWILFAFSMHCARGVLVRLTPTKAVDTGDEKTIWIAESLSADEITRYTWEWGYLCITIEVQTKYDRDVSASFIHEMDKSDGIYRSIQRTIHFEEGNYRKVLNWCHDAQTKGKKANQEKESNETDDESGKQVGNPPKAHIKGILTILSRISLLKRNIVNPQYQNNPHYFQLYIPAIRQTHKNKNPLDEDKKPIIISGLDKKQYQSIFGEISKSNNRGANVPDNEKITATINQQYNPSKGTTRDPDPDLPIDGLALKVGQQMLLELQNSISELNTKGATFTGDIPNVFSLSQTPAAQVTPTARSNVPPTTTQAAGATGNRQATTPAATNNVPAAGGQSNRR